MTVDEAGPGPSGAGLSWAGLGAARAAWVGLAQKILAAQAKTIGVLVPSGELNPGGGPRVAAGLALALALIEDGADAVVVMSEGAAALARSLDPALTVLALMDDGGAGNMAPRLAGLLGEVGARFRHLVVDLSDFEAHGEHLAAMAMVDGVVLVARAGVTGEAELCAAASTVPAGRCLGVLLVGGVR